MAQLYTNNAWSVLNGAISNSATTITLAAGTGSRFPTPTGGDYFLATLIGYDGSNNENAWEIIKVTARSSDTLTVVRGQESTSAIAWANATRIELRVTAGSLSGLVEKSAPVITGSTTVTGTGLAYQADFSNATPSLRYAFKTTTSNGSTIVSAVPNGTGTESYYQVYNASNLTNASYAYLGITGSVASINSGKLGTGTALPLVFSTDSTERFRLDSASNRFQADFSNATVANRLMFQTSTANNSTIVASAPNGTSTVAGWQARNNSDVANSSTFTLSTDSTQALLSSAQNGAGAYLPIAVYTGGSQSLNVATDGTFTSVRGAIGYGTGAGGTGSVVSGSVVINKPSGEITLPTAAGSTAWQFFTLTNSFIAATDMVKVSQKSGTNKYLTHVTNTVTGSCQIAYATTGGTVSEQPVFRFEVTKGATA